jgi:hypothetical protein
MSWIQILFEYSSKMKSAIDHGFAISTFEVSQGENIVVLYEPKIIEFFAEKKGEDQTLVESFKSLNTGDHQKMGVVAMIQYSSSSGLVLSTKKSKKSKIKYVNRSAALGRSAPLIYDSAIWYSGGLASDRGSVSPRAQGVWNVYKTRSDVEIIPLEDSGVNTPSGATDFAVKMSSKPDELSDLENFHDEFAQHLDEFYEIDDFELNEALYSIASLLFTNMLGKT